MKMKRFYIISLRNPYYKNAAAPKDYSFFSTGKNRLAVTEGMFDFFSLCFFQLKRIPVFHSKSIPFKVNKKG
jgi:hypothetical protein